MKVFDNILFPLRYFNVYMFAVVIRFSKGRAGMQIS